MPPLRRSTKAMLATFSQLAHGHGKLPLHGVKLWSQRSSFKIDALGLVTFLGADEVDLAVGSLQRRRFTEWLPLLATFIVTGKRFAVEQPGFVLYNLDDGIITTELKGWFSRWLSTQTINNGTTRFVWEENMAKPQGVGLVAPVLAFLLVVPLLVCTVLMGDWYGVANAIAIIISILVRAGLVSQLRTARDQQTVASEASARQQKTTFVIRSDGKMVTIMAPDCVVKSFTKDAVLKNKLACRLLQYVGWIALGVHVCVLGMCTLFSQIYTVLLLVLSTWVFTCTFDFDVNIEYRPETQFDNEFADIVVEIPFNRHWTIIKTNPAKNQLHGERPQEMDRRQTAWAWLLLKEEQEKILERWNLPPAKENTQWWDEYKARKREFQLAEDARIVPTSSSINSTSEPKAPQVSMPEVESAFTDDHTLAQS
ncbi:hypothetical protein KCU78_g1026, partial [Aureobasidium melanogenum]